MRTLLRLAAFTWLLLPSAVGAACIGKDLLAELKATNPAAHGALAARAAAVPNAEGVFWRVERPGSAPSHIYGTMHIDGLEDTVPARVWAALNTARIAIFEMTDETTAALIDDIRSGRLPDRDRRRPTFESFLSPEDARRPRQA